ncbi:MAG: oligogalacturonate lyase family protein [Prevotellaceae bacterium]|jgi:oligogalacturonide lyase|nr:oligogalacturonate lyase family protein [Prevotellaceae bacterium]
MKKVYVLLAFSPLCTGYAAAQSSLPLEWVDSLTHHRIIRLTRTGTDNKSFYFHNNPFVKTPDGSEDLMTYAGVVDGRRQLFCLNLKTLESVQLTNRTRGANGEIVDKAHREVIYQAGDSVFATHIDTRTTRLIHVFPHELGASISTVNANGTLLAGKYSEAKKANEIRAQYPLKSQYFNRIYEAHVKHSLFTLNIQTGEMKVIHEENEWTNHIQFSPADPDLLMFCHEGPWHKVDRIWTINVKTGNVMLMHKRSMDMEIAGHEFFSPDGKTIWFDLQQPRSVTFFVCGADVATGKEVKYSLTRDEWSIHFNISPDLQLFCGDGGDPGQVAKAQDGMWIYLFRPQGDKLVSERLVCMKNHSYKLEPNVHFSPDKKWVIFRSNMLGETHVYAVEINKNS